MVTLRSKNSKSAGFAQEVLQSLAMQLNAAVEFQIRHFHHTPEQKAWRVQIVWNGQTIANSIFADRTVAIQKASQIAVKNVEKFTQPLLKQKESLDIAEVQQGIKLDSFGRELHEYIESHATPKKATTVSTQTEAMDKLAVPGVKGMSRVRSYVGIKIAENQPLLELKHGNDSDSNSNSSDDENVVDIGVYGMMGKFMDGILKVLPTPATVNCYVSSSSSS